MALRVKLNSTILNDTPRGWEKAKITHKRNRQLNGLFLDYTSELIFWGDGFTFIDNIITQAFCDVIDIIIETDECDPGTFVTEFEGVIPIVQISELNVTTCQIKSRLVDRGFNARINNNKNLTAVIDADNSKNRTTITPTPSVTIGFYDPDDAFQTYSFGSRTCYRLFEVFKYMIAYMTDGDVSFVSTLLDTGGDFEDVVILSGHELRIGSGNGETPDVSFGDLYDELNKKRHIGFAIEPDGSGGFQLRLENAEFFEAESAAINFANVDNIKMSFNLKEMYSDIDVGSMQFELASSLGFPPVRLKGWRKENFTVIGECNLENTLDLVSEFIVDSNTIEDILVNGEDKHDDKIIMVTTDGTNAIKNNVFNPTVSQGTATAGTAGTNLEDTAADFVSDGVTAGMKIENQTTGVSSFVSAVVDLNNLTIGASIFSSGDDYRIVDSPFTYNGLLNNQNSILRWLGGIPNSIVKFFGSGDDNFLATITSDTTITSFPTLINPIIYNDDSTPPNFDTNGNYDTVTGRYSIPADGLYNFRMVSNIKMTGDMGSDTILNGGFSSAANWSILGTGWAISAGQAFLFTDNNSATLFQLQTLNTNERFVMQFQITFAETGSVQISSSSGGDVNTRIIHGVFNTIGVKTVQIDMTDIASHDRIEFTGIRAGAPTPSAILTIDNVIMQPLPKFTITSTINRYNNNIQLLETFTQNNTAVLDFDLSEKIISIEQNSGSFDSFAGDIVRTSINIVRNLGNNGRVILQAGSSFETTLVEDGGGEIAGKDPADFNSYIYEFEKKLSLSQFNNLRDNPELAIVFNKGTNADENITAWRDDIRYDKQTKKATFTVRSKQKIVI